LKVLGNKSLLNENLALILNSSQSKTPCGDDPWVKQTSLATSRLANLGHVLITSLGLATWEIQVQQTARWRGRQIIICPDSEGAECDEIFRRIVVEFGLSADEAAMIFLKPGEKSRSPKGNWQMRDEAAMARANKIYPVSIRPGGKLERMLKLEANLDKLDMTFALKYQKALVQPPHYDIAEVQLEYPVWNYLTHWTRTQHGPWPGQTRHDYYSKLVVSGNSYPNNAFATLLNIVEEKRIRASSEKIRDSYPAIGFTECSPADSLKMLRWCPKRVNWNFEPYGIAIARDAAEKLGVRPVVYGTDGDYKKFSEPDKPYFQSRGGDNVDWSREREWRHIGDIDLGQLPMDRMRLIAWREPEAAFLRGRTEIPVMAFRN